MSEPADRRYGPATLPRSRGPLSAAVVEALRRPPHDLPAGLGVDLDPADPITDEDLQLTLFLCYELHYRGWLGVDERWEWQPTLLALRARCERSSRRRCAGWSAHRRCRPPGWRPAWPSWSLPTTAGAGRDAATACRPHPVPRVRRPPLRLPPAGGGPAQLGAAPPRRPGQGRARGDPDRRVRQRPAGPDARRAVPAHPRPAGPGHRLRRPPRRGPGGRRWRPTT